MATSTNPTGFLGLFYRTGKGAECGFASDSKQICPKPDWMKIGGAVAILVLAVVWFTRKRRR